MQQDLAAELVLSEMGIVHPPYTTALSDRISCESDLQALNVVSDTDSKPCVQLLKHTRQLYFRIQSIVDPEP